MPSRTLDLPSQYLKFVRWRIGGHEIRNGFFCSPRTAEKLNGPFRNSFFFDVNISTGLRLVDVFPLKDKRQRLFTPGRFFRKLECFAIGFKGIVVIIAFELVWSSALWMAPNAILKDFIPHVATASL